MSLECQCIRCQEARPLSQRVMPSGGCCGNKRCPKATDHRLACTNSNEPGQPGSDYQVFQALKAGLPKNAQDLLDAAEAVQNRRRCSCDLRDARWNPRTHQCGTCGGIAWPVFDKLQRGRDV